MSAIAGQTKAAPAWLERFGPDPVRFVWLAAAVALAVATARAWRDATSLGFAHPAPFVDFWFYRAAAERFLHGDGFYWAWQLAGPYDFWTDTRAVDPVLYPPTTIPFFLLTTVMPPVLNWLIPLGVTGAVIAWHRPRPLALIVLALLAVFPGSLAQMAYFGNQTMWFVMLLAIATTGRSWAGPLVILKPSLFPFALWGVRHRSWWIGAALLAAVSVPFAGLWVDYFHAITNARGAGPFYSLWQFPAMLVPVVAWLGRRRS